MKSKAIKISEEIMELIEKESRKYELDKSALLTQIVRKHYGLDNLFTQSKSKASKEKQ